MESVGGDTIATAGSACSGLAKARIFEKKKAKKKSLGKKKSVSGWGVVLVYAQGTRTL